jgi:uncharacterized protein
MSRKLAIGFAALIVLVAVVFGFFRYRFWTLNEADLALKDGNYQRTLKLLEPWARFGDSNAQYTVGRLHAFGLGTPKDDATAIELFRRAGLFAVADVDPAAPAEYYVGLDYLEGRGVQGNVVEARRWLERSAKGGYPKATEQLEKIPVAQ